MGQDLSVDLKRLQSYEQSELNLNWDLETVQDLLRNFRKLNCGFCLVPSQFECWLHRSNATFAQAGESRKIFDLFDNTRIGRVDVLEFMGAIAMLSLSNFEKKSRFCFELFDFNMNGSLSVCESVLMVRSILLGVCKLLQIPPLKWPQDKVIKNLVEDGYKLYDRDHNETLTYGEFISWANGQRKMREYIDAFSIRTKRRSSMNQLQDDPLHHDTATDSEVDSVSSDHSVASLALRSRSGKQTKSQILDPPGNFNTETKLELQRTLGFSSHCPKFALRFSKFGVVYTSGTAVVGLDADKKRTIHTTQHDVDIFALDVHPRGKVIACSDDSANGNVRVWDISTTPRTLVSELRSLNKLGGRVLVAFSTNGDFLATSTCVNNSTVHVWDWRAKRLVAVGKGELPLSIDICWASDERSLALCSSKGLVVFSFDHHHKDAIQLQRRHKQCLRADLAANEKYITVARLPDAFVVATSLGELLLVAKTGLIKRVAAYNKGIAVTSICSWSGGLATGSVTGVYKLWDLNLQEFPKLTHTFDSEVVSLVFSKDQNKFLAGTKQGHVFEASIKDHADEDGLQIAELLHSHFGEKILDLATHPYIERVCTCGDDGFVYVWDVTNGTLVARKDCLSIDNANPCCIAYAPNGRYVVVGLQSGALLLFTEDLQKQIGKVRVSSSRVTAMSFAPNEIFLAVAYAKDSVFTFDMSRVVADPTATFSRPLNNLSVFRCKGLFKLDDGCIQNFDWSNDSCHLRSDAFFSDPTPTGGTESRREIIYFDVSDKGTCEISCMAEEDMHWATYTCCSKQGIASQDGSSRMEYTIEALSSQVLVLRSGSDRSRPFPCGHMHGVRKVRYLPGERYAVTVGNRGTSLLVWKVLRAAHSDVASDSDEEIDPLLLTSMDIDTDTEGSNSIEWKGEILEPTPLLHKAGPSVYASLLSLNDHNSDLTVELERVQGCLARAECVKLIGGGTGSNENLRIAFAAGGLCVIQDRHDLGKQQFLNPQESSPVSCLAMSSERDLLVAGHGSMRGESCCKVRVWELDSRQLMTELDVPWNGDIMDVALTPDNDTVCAIGDTYLAVFAWRNSNPLVACSKSSSTNMRRCLWTSGTTLVTGSGKGLDFWKVECSQKTLEGRKGIFPSGQERRVLCISRNHRSLFAGMFDGTVTIWSLSAQTLIQTTAVLNTGPVYCIHALNTKDVFIGGRDGVLSWFDGLRGQPDAVKSFGTAVLAVDIQRNVNDELEVVCLLQGGKLQWGLLEAQTGGSFKLAEERLVVQTHGEGELWGAAADPTSQQLYSAGDDGILRAWKLPSFKEIHSFEIKEKARAVAVSEDGIFLAVGLLSGQVKTFTFEDEEFTHQDTLTEPTDWIQVLSFAPSMETTPLEKDETPESPYLAVGSHDCNIYIYSVENQQCTWEATLEGHTSYITHLDWTFYVKNKDRYYLQSTCGGNEMLFWNVTDGVMLKSAKLTQDADWCSWTCDYGWPVQGLYESNSTEVICCQRSRGNTALVVGLETGVLRLTPFPFHSEKEVKGMKSKSYCAHSSFISSVSVTAQDKYIVSTGGSDHCIMLWRARELERSFLGFKEYANKKTRGEIEQELETKMKALCVNSNQSKDDIVRVETDNQGKKVVQSDLFATASKEESHPPTAWLSKVKSTSSRFTKSEPKQLQLRKLCGHYPETLRFAAPGKLLIFAAGSVAYVKSLITKKSSFQLEHGDRILCLEVSSDGEKVVTADEGGDVIVWDSQSGIVSCRLTLPDKVTRISLSPSSLFVAIQTKEQLHIYNLNDSVKVQTSPCPADVINLHFRTSEQLIQVCESQLCIWNLGSSKRFNGKSRKLQNAEPITTSAVLNDYILTGHNDGRIMTWTTHGSQNSEINTKNDSSVVNISVGNDNLSFAVSFDNHEVSIFHSSNGEFTEKHVVNLDQLALTLALSSGSLLVSLNDGSIVEYNVDDLKQKPAILHFGHRSAQQFAIIPDSSRVISVGSDCVVKLWNMHTHAIVNEWTLPAPAAAVAVNKHVVVATINGQLLIASTDLKHTIREAELQHPNGSEKLIINCVQYSPDGKLLAVSCCDRIYLMESRYYAVERILRGHTGVVTELDWSTDSLYLTSNSYLKGELLYWSASDCKPLKDSPKASLNVEWSTGHCPFSELAAPFWKAKHNVVSCAKGTQPDSFAVATKEQILVQHKNSSYMQAFASSAVPSRVSKQLAFVNHDTSILSLRDGIFFLYTLV